MTNQLPAHLQGYQPARDLAGTIDAALGSGQPPFISIEGQRFTLVDADGSEEVLTTMDPKIGIYFDCIIVDVNEHKSKTYYPKAYDPKNPSPPICFSDNGLTPSLSAGQPQSATCGSCPHAVIGSAIGFKGGKTSACRDGIKIAVVLPQYPDEVRLLRVPPNSFKNFRGFKDWFKKTGSAMEIVLTRIYFQQGEQGTLCFTPLSYNQDANVHALIVAMLRDKMTDALIGRNDMPRPLPLAAPAPAQVAAPLAQPAAVAEAQPTPPAAPSHARSPYPRCAL